MDAPDPNAPTPQPDSQPSASSAPVPEALPESVPNIPAEPGVAPAPISAPIDQLTHAVPADLTAARKRARARHDPFAHRRGEPRTFAILWMLYMLAAITVSLSPIGATGLLSVDTYRPSARLLAALMAMGIAVVWPMVRLSQVRPRLPGRAAAQDLIIVMVPVAAMCAAQAAPWMAGWPWTAGVAMALGLFGWSLVVAGILLHAFASELRRDPTPSPRPPSDRETDEGVRRAPDVGIRISAMVILMALAISGPLVSALGYLPASSVQGGNGLRADWAMMASPVGFALEVAKDRVWTGRAAAVGSDHWWGVAGIAAAGVVLVVTGRARRRRIRSVRELHGHAEPGAGPA